LFHFVKFLLAYETPFLRPLNHIVRSPTFLPFLYQ
jgi:hypothetical protein